MGGDKSNHRRSTSSLEKTCQHVIAMFLYCRNSGNPNKTRRYDYFPRKPKKTLEDSHKARLLRLLTHILPQHLPSWGTNISRFIAHSPVNHVLFILFECPGKLGYNPYRGFPKWWVSPTTVGFPTKNDHFGV